MISEAISIWLSVKITHVIWARMIIPSILTPEIHLILLRATVGTNSAGLDGLDTLNSTINNSILPVVMGSNTRLALTNPVGGVHVYHMDSVYWLLQRQLGHWDNSTIGSLKGIENQSLWRPAHYLLRLMVKMKRQSRLSVVASFPDNVACPECFWLGGGV